MDGPERAPAGPPGPVAAAPADPSLDGSAPWTRAQVATLVVLVVAMLSSLVVTVHPWYDQANDAALYVHTARAIAAGQGYSYFGVPFIIRPPGFSFLIAPLAPHPTDFLLLNTLVSLTGVLCVALLYCFYRPRLGTAVSAGLCVFVWLNPLFQTLCTQVMTDVPGSAFVFGALLLDRAARRRPTLGRHALLGLVVAAGLYVRSVCTLLIPAILLARIARLALGPRSARVRRALLTSWPVLVIPALAWLPWGLRNAHADVPVPPEHVYLHSYSTAMWHVDSGDPSSPRLGLGEILARVPQQLGEMLPLLGAGYREGSSLPDWLTIAISALGIACATAILVRRRAPAEFLFGGVLMVLAIYFAFKPRLAVTLFLLGPPAMCEVALWLARTERSRRLVAGVLALLLAVPSLVAFDPYANREAIETLAKDRQRLVRFLDKRFPPGAAVAMPTAWHVGVETDRPMVGMKVTIKHQDTAALMAMLDELGVVAVAINDRQPDGPAFAQVLSRIYSQHAVVGRWSVFFDRP